MRTIPEDTLPRVELGPVVGGQVAAALEGIRARAADTAKTAAFILRNQDQIQLTPERELHLANLIANHSVVEWSTAAKWSGDLRQAANNPAQTPEGRSPGGCM